MKLLRAEPAVLLGFIQAVLALAVGLGLHLTAGQSGAVLAAVSAVAALLAAVAVRPFHIAAATGLATAIVTLLVSFKVPGVSEGLVASVNAVIGFGLMLVLRGNVTPVGRVQA